MVTLLHHTLEVDHDLAILAPGAFRNYSPFQPDLRTCMISLTLHSLAVHPLDGLPLKPAHLVVRLASPWSGYFSGGIASTVLTTKTAGVGDIEEFAYETVMKGCLRFIVVNRDLANLTKRALPRSPCGYLVRFRVHTQNFGGDNFSRRSKNLDHL